MVRSGFFIFGRVGWFGWLDGWDILDGKLRLGWAGCQGWLRGNWLGWEGFLGGNWPRLSGMRKSDM